MKPPLVSIVIVNFNQKQYSLDCLKSLELVTYSNFETIFVDNGSVDGTMEAVEKEYPKTIRIQTGANLGFTGGNNVGFEKASGKYILLLNNDTKVTPNFLDALVSSLEKDKNLGIVQSKILLMDDHKLLDSVASYQTITGFLYHRGYLEEDKGQYDHFIYSFSGKGACLMVRREVTKLGLLDDSYFAYFEETDLCWRSWILGYKVGFEPGSIIFHKMGATSSKMKSAFIHYHSFKNRLRTIIKNGSSSTLLYMLPLHLGLCIFLSIFFFLSGERSGAKSVLAAIWWNMLNLGSTLKLRAKIQKSRVSSDLKIFSQVMWNPSLFFYLRHLSLVSKYLSHDRKS